MTFAVTIGLDTLSFLLALLLVTLGLIIIFGLMNVINMAHGEFFLLGAYTVVVVQDAGGSFWLALIAAPLVLALVGLVLEEAVIRHVYHRFIDTILATWGLSIAIKQIVIVIFGATSQGVANPFPEPVSVLGVVYPSYRLFIMAVAVVVAAATFALIYRTRLGLAVRGVIANREMASSLGINTRLMDRGTFAFGAALAGLAGAVMAPIMSVDPQMGVGFLIPAFLSILVGGAGTLLGALLGTTVISGATTIVASIWSQAVAQIAVFGLAIVIIRLFPQGLTGGASMSGPAALIARSAAVWAVLVVLPLVLDAWTLSQLAQFIPYGIFAMSLALIWGQVGILSFGQAIFFGIGGYAMAVVTKGMVPWAGDHALVGLLAAVVIPGIVANILGRLLFHGRGLAGAYFAIVTLSAAVIIERAATRVDFIGGFNGLLSIPPLTFGDDFMTPTQTFYLMLAIAGVVYAGLMWLVRSPVGTVLRAIRDNDERTAFFGYDVAGYKVFIFTLSGAVAGLAGALFVTEFGFVSPALIGFGLSTEVLIWVALGGREVLLAAFLGAILVRGIEGVLSDVLGSYWLLALGVLFVVSVVLAATRPGRLGPAAAAAAADDAFGGHGRR